MNNAIAKQLGWPSLYNALMHGYGQRKDGTQKGSGYFGAMRGRNGEDVTEFSLSFDDMEAPSVTPWLNEDQLNAILRGEMTPEIARLAIGHARHRQSMGLSPYWMPVEKIYNRPGEGQF